MVLAPGPRLACLPDAIHGEIFRELGDDASRAALYSSCTTFRESPAVNAQIDKLVVKRLQGGLERLSSFPRFARLQQLSMVACQATLEGAMGHSKTAQKARAVLETVEQLSLEVGCKVMTCFPGPPRAGQQAPSQAQRIRNEVQYAGKQRSNRKLGRVSGLQHGAYWNSQAMSTRTRSGLLPHRPPASAATTCSHNHSHSSYCVPTAVTSGTGSMPCSCQHQSNSPG